MSSHLPPGNKPSTVPRGYCGLVLLLQGRALTH